MKTDKTAGRCILACLLAYLVIKVYYLSCYVVPYGPEESWESLACLFLVQSVFLAACILAYFLIAYLRQKKREDASPFGSLLIVNEEGKIKNEVLLQGRRSFLITGKKDGKEVFVETAPGPVQGRHLYGVCNLVAGCWFLESVSAERPIGLRRGDGDAIYRLKEEIPYQLSGTDVIYADTCKIVIKQREPGRKIPMQDNHDIK